MLLPFEKRFLALTLAIAAVLVLAVVALLLPGWNGLIGAGLAVALVLALLGLYDLFQTRHAVLRNYPIIGRLRFLLEDIRPEIRQYFFEDDKSGMPFARDKRAIVYQRAKQQLDKRPFGTHYNVYGENFEWLHHSIAPRPAAAEPFRVRIGGPRCTKPYDASVFNISAMSYGALSANAIRALNKGARAGGFAHDTGEGGVSPYHREGGGDLIWELGSGYFGCRADDGGFDAEKFAATASDPQIKMIEVKLSQGAKPGHGGVLPRAKITPEIAAIRGVPMDRDCVSPACHAAFSSPAGLLEFLARLRGLSGGKPVGFKLCIGHPWEFLGVVKAMLETGQKPDFIVVDGKEGGTGAAPLEFMDHIGMPMRDGLSFVHSALVGASLRDEIKIGCAGKIISGFDMARVMALGADWCNAARGFMFALGCIQAQHCHTGACPTGVATQDPMRQRALVVPDKAERVARFHEDTVKSLAEIVAAVGLDHPRQLLPQHILRRGADGRIHSLREIYPLLQPGELLSGIRDAAFAEAWALASATSFAPAPGNV
ncbi:FMN-binding glutamate synthase family protein [Aestuariivirga sp.]|uniref:FMN-binding glutamate synthase family protein n=1 Tax=Aestuariivirga sp. TaxID=2650926 RepID=UPI0025B9BF4A|nr:FMN-binding glutamate synthase family protein [Aestuariivirga sp.]